MAKPKFKAECDANPAFAAYCKGAGIIKPVAKKKKQKTKKK